jgi:uncharacterized membrane protein YeaQ/YmgE (transglycosylase-associated protein family)
MALAFWIIFTATIGEVASSILEVRLGAGKDLILGIAGAIGGSWLMSLFGKSGVTGFNLYSFLVAVIGSMLLLILVRGLYQLVRHIYGKVSGLIIQPRSKAAKGILIYD